SLDLGRSFASVHIARLAADEGFICFDRPGHLVDRAGMLRVANAVQHEPRSTLGYFDVTGYLVGTNAVLAVRKQPHSTQPLVQFDRRILEDSANLNRELLAAF